MGKTACVTTERPYHLHCSIDADDPDEIARVLREVAAEILIQRDNTASADGEMMLEMAGGTYSNWYARLEHSKVSQRMPS